MHYADVDLKKQKIVKEIVGTLGDNITILVIRRIWYRRDADKKEIRMRSFRHAKNDDDEFSVYFKCNGDIEVHVFRDGTEIYSVPNDYERVYTVEEETVSCPQCGFEEIYYHNGEYICTECECTFIEQELVDYCGCDIFHGFSTFF